MALLRRGLVLFVLLLLWPATASAHTDGVRQLELAWPANGTVTSPYDRDGSRWHPGIDIGILRSLDVTAAAPGIVRRVGFARGYEGYGRIVEVDVGEGFTALYAHLSAERVRVGEYVTTGIPIGVAGCTGWCTGTHLHLELRYRGAAVDPTPFLR